MKKMVVLDMDNTILKGSFIDAAAKEFGFTEELLEARSQKLNHLILTKQIARFLKGKNIAEILEVTENISFAKDVVDVVKRLKKRGYIVGIITHSYDCVATHIKNKIGADFALAYELEFSKSVATGEVKIPSFFVHNSVSICDHEMCKTNALLEVAERYKIKIPNVIAMGDGVQDACMVEHAGIGVAFCSQDKTLNTVASKRINSGSFKPLLSFAR